MVEAGCCFKSGLPGRCLIPDRLVFRAASGGQVQSRRDETRPGQSSRLSLAAVVLSSPSTKEETGPFSSPCRLTNRCKCK
jgi:hypothetical protein